MRVVFIVPCYNMSENFEVLVESITSQKSEDWSCIMIDDISDDDTWGKISNLQNSDGRFTGVKNLEKKYALRNIVENSRSFQDRDDIIIATIDGDDSLCNDETVGLLIEQYKKGSDVVWTGHRWDINNMNISREMPKDVDPYSYPWCSSHLRTFRCSLLKGIDDVNFKDTVGNWFKRGYDQALMLPILSLTSNRYYIPEICYKYNINSVSIKDRSWEESGQISTINIVRSRGFIK